VNIPVIFEDEYLLIVNKPSGLLTIPTPHHESRTLTSILNDDAAQKRAPYRLHPCHRLDRETSGAIIYAKGKSVQKKMMQLFQARRVEKTYVAFVHGRLPRKEGTISLPLEGMPATTEYRQIAERKGFSVVEVKPLSGRKNQIRLHFKQLGNPLVGETRFAFRKDFALRHKRVCLHAKALTFLHPVGQRRVSVEAPLAPDLEEFLRTH